MPGIGLELFFGHILVLSQVYVHRSSFSLIESEGTRPGFQLVFKSGDKLSETRQQIEQAKPCPSPMTYERSWRGAPVFAINIQSEEGLCVESYSQVGRQGGEPASSETGIAVLSGEVAGYFYSLWDYA